MMRESPPHDRPVRAPARARRMAPTYRRALEQRLERWEAFGRLLEDPEERDAFGVLTRSARRHIEEVAYVGSPDLLESILLSVLLDLARRLPPEAVGPRGRVRRRAGAGARSARTVPSLSSLPTPSSGAPTGRPSPPPAAGPAAPIPGEGPEPVLATP
jgi:hypothetical protein